MEKTINGVKITGIKKTVGEFNRCSNLARMIQFDRGTGEVWLDVHASTNEWNQYHDPDIICVYRTGAYPFGAKKITMGELVEAIEDEVAWNEKVEKENENLCY